MTLQTNRRPAYVNVIEQDRQELSRQLDCVSAMLCELRNYLLSDKFAGADADYVHVRTDMLPKITEIEMQARR